MEPMNHEKLFNEIAKRLDEKTDLIREDVKELVSLWKEHNEKHINQEIRLVRVEGTLGYITTGISLGMSIITAALGYLAYKFIDFWPFKK